MLLTVCSCCVLHGEDSVKGKALCSGTGLVFYTRSQAKRVSYVRGGGGVDWPDYNMHCLKTSCHFVIMCFLFASLSLFATSLMP